MLRTISATFLRGLLYLGICLEYLDSKRLLKIFLAILCLVAYSYAFSWKTAILIVGAISFHEQSHVQAMKWLNVPNKGFYLIPFMGGVSVAQGGTQSLADSVIIAIMGPIGGMLLALLTWIVYLLTGIPLLAAAAYWQALVNLFNLLPVSPLDGGLIFRSLILSISTSLGKLLSFSTPFIFVYLFMYTHFPIFLILVGLAVMDCTNLHNLDRETMPRKLTLREALISVISYALLASILFVIMRYNENIPGADFASNFLKK